MPDTTKPRPNPPARRSTRTRSTAEAAPAAPLSASTIRDRKRRARKLALAERLELVPRPDLLLPVWPGGRPTKLSPEITERLVTALATGLHLETACDLVSLTRQSVFNWMDQGRKDIEQGKESEHAAFFDAISRAIATAEASIVRAIGMGIAGLIPERPGYYPPDPKAGIQFLQIRYRERYRKQTQFDIAGVKDAPVALQLGIKVYIPAEDPEPEREAPRPTGEVRELPPAKARGNGHNGNGHR
jgi:hypothetical protein